MGGGPEHILCLLPFPNADHEIERLKKKFPDVKITFKYIHFANYGKEPEVVSEGTRTRDLWTGGAEELYANMTTDKIFSRM